MTKINGYKINDLAEMLVRISDVNLSIEDATNFIITARNAFLRK
jgi:hypothetical protein